MARTIGAVGKARYVVVSIDKLVETFGPNARIHVSIEHHGAMLGINRDNAPRVKSVTLDDGAVPVVAVSPIQPVGVVPVVDIPESKEPAGFKVDFKEVD